MPSKSKKPAPPAKGKPAAKKKQPLGMGLGKLKGVFQERKSRLDTEIDRQSGNGKKKK